MKSIKYVTFLSVVMLGTTLMAQPDTATVPSNNQFPNSVRRSIAITGQTNNFRSMNSSELGEAIDQFKQAESESEKADARKKMRSALETRYDESLDEYEKHLAEMEKKIAEMREQVTRRRDAKSEIVDLKLRMLVNEVNGLGWPDDRANRFFTAPMSRGLSGGQNRLPSARPARSPFDQSMNSTVPRSSNRGPARNAGPGR